MRILCSQMKLNLKIYLDCITKKPKNTDESGRVHQHLYNILLETNFLSKFYHKVHFDDNSVIDWDYRILDKSKNFVFVMQSFAYFISILGKICYIIKFSQLVLFSVARKSSNKSFMSFKAFTILFTKRSVLVVSQLLALDT